MMINKIPSKTRPQDISLFVCSFICSTGSGLRHYSRKTLKTYANWSRQFQRFLKNKPPHELTGDGVKSYLTYLAVNCHVASTTQNQAFNSLLFFYRHGLKREFGELKDVPRAKKSRYVPMALSREEIAPFLSSFPTHSIWW